MGETDLRSEGEVGVYIGRERDSIGEINRESKKRHHTTTQHTKTNESVKGGASN
jgi:hypothetical protein